METIILEENTINGFDITFKYSRIYDECPNDIYRIWEPTDDHKGGETVQDPNAGRHGYKFWLHSEYTPGELAKEYAKQGVKNPSKEAYSSLQKELLHYLEGYMLFIEIHVSCAGITLAEDSISTDFSYEYWNSEEECAKECAENNFSVFSLIEEAKKQINNEIGQLSSQIEKLSAISANNQ